MRSTPLLVAALVAISGLGVWAYSRLDRRLSAVEVQHEVVRKIGGKIEYALDEASVEIARMQMQSFAAAIDQFRMQSTKLPDSLEDLTQTDDRHPFPLMKSIPKDPWDPSPAS